MTGPNGPTAYEPVGSAQPLSHSDVWSPLAPVGGGENPRVNGDESVLKTGQSLHRAALGSVGPGRCETSRRS